MISIVNLTTESPAYRGDCFGVAPQLLAMTFEGL